jgi:hypothetical protein
MRPASFGTGPPPEGRDVRGRKRRRIKLRVYSLEELFRCTRAELFALHHKIASALAQLPEGSRERLAALTNLRNIRRVPARPTLMPK